MSIEIEKIDDYNINLELLISQYKDKTNFVNIVKSDNSEANELEDALFEIRDNYWIDTAEGVQLDVIGRIAGESRLGRSDADYRMAIKIRIAINNGSGEPETVITFMKFYFNSTKIQLKSVGNANLEIWTDILLDNNGYNELLKVIDAGIGLYVIFNEVTPFGFLDNVDALGFGKLDVGAEVLGIGGGKIIGIGGGKIIGNVGISNESYDSDILAGGLSAIIGV